MFSTTVVHFAVSLSVIGGIQAQFRRRLVSTNSKGKEAQETSKKMFAAWTLSNIPLQIPSIRVLRQSKTLLVVCDYYARNWRRLGWKWKNERACDQTIGRKRKEILRKRLWSMQGIRSIGEIMEALLDSLVDISHLIILGRFFVFVLSKESPFQLYRVAYSGRSLIILD